MNAIWGSRCATSPFVEIFAWLGFVGAQLLFYSPTTTFRKIIKNQSVAGYDHTPYVVSVATCTLWVAYGLRTPGRFMPFLTNAVGGFAEINFVIIYLFYSSGKQRRSCQCDVVVTIVFLTIIIAIALLIPLPLKLKGEDSTSSLLGLSAACVNTFMYAAPLNIARTVIQTKSVQWMPLPLTLGGLICSLCWTVYAVLVGDVSVFIPNTAGDFLGFTQLIIYFTYHSPQSSSYKLPSSNLPEPQSNEDRTTPLLQQEEGDDHHEEDDNTSRRIQQQRRGGGANGHSSDDATTINNTDIL
mmetsp:Transcript_8721/g.12101  ORF Transcript_8721/g.12101 Transcript_8721/m.12101 type:complete len:298 (-) Transcript_8721:155-1048(-)